MFKIEKVKSLHLKNKEAYCFYLDSKTIKLLYSKYTHETHKNYSYIFKIISQISLPLFLFD